MATPQTAMGQGPAMKALRRGDFDAGLKMRGIALSADEADYVFALASQIHQGAAGFGKLFRAADPPGGDPAGLGIFEAGKRLREGSLTCLALTRACLTRIAERDHAFRAFTVVDEARALETARRLDADLQAGRDRGPLHGIPVGVKDLLDIAGLPTTAGSKGRADHIAAANAEVVERLVEGGAVPLGKLATYEWGTVGPAEDTLYPPARNPWSLEHITGGSSSGCAAAVAGGLLRTTIGSDTGGSLRGPASYCGVVGFKPTFGLAPTRGSLGMSPSMDHLGPMSATSAEAALTLDVMTGRTGEEAATRFLGQGIEGLRIAYARNWFVNDPQAAPAVIAAMDAAMSALSELGAKIAEVELPDYGAVETAGAAVLHADGFAAHASAMAERPEGYGRKTFQSLAAGVCVTPAEYAQAKRAGAAFRAMLDEEIFANFDALATVCALTPALPVSLFAKGSAWTPMRTIGFNLTGHPALAMPMGFCDGLPLGMQIIGPHFGEARICQIGDAFERATDHSALLAPPPPG